MTTRERFLAKVELDPVTGCVNWTGYKDRAGYGRVTIDKKTRMAHRVVYEWTIGLIPSGLHIDHLCRNPACVNAAHMEPVTPGENTARGLAPSAGAIRTNVCINGHPFTPENTAIHKKFRKCRRCQIVYTQRWRGKNISQE